MCNFISWVEIKPRDGEKEILFLTDEKVFSPRGRKMLRECRDNDLLGHGAIKLYYSQVGGCNKEIRDFWNTDKLPPEIAKLIPDFDLIWGKMFWECCQVDDFKYLICFAPTKYAEKAWKELLKRNPHNGVLEALICRAPLKQANKAWKKLLKRNPDDGDLLALICHAPSKQANKAWKKLLKRNPSDFILHKIAISAPPKQANKASSLLKKWQLKK